jgi:sugar phosphate isomerase/epimerase
VLVALRSVSVSREVGICPATLLVDPMVADHAALAAAAAAAVSAGFTDASVWSFQLDGFSGSGLRPVVLEAALAWAGTDADAAGQEAEQYAELVAAQGSNIVAAVTMEDTIPDVDRARRQLRALARAVSARGATVCVEFFAWSAVRDLRIAWDLVGPIPEVGLILDSFHWQRQPGGPAWDLLSSIPGERITYLQLADAAANPMEDPEAEAMTSRLLPGAGVVDFARLFDALDAIGADPFVAVETFNPGFVAEVGVEQAAVALHDAACAVAP